MFHALAGGYAEAAGVTARILAAIAVTTALTVAAAAAPPSASLIATGHRLADAQCSECHRMTGGGPAGWTDSPSLAAIANRPATTDAGLRKIIESPQLEMLHVGRSPADAAALAAYIMSLRGTPP
jgi:mono/diheme cytochrome c family protein